MTRNSYVVTVRDVPGPALVEEVRTGRKAQLDTVAEALERIETWLADPPQSESTAQTHGEAT